MINTTNTSGCNNKENVKGASFSRNVNTQFNVTCVLNEFVYSQGTPKILFGPSFLSVDQLHASVRR